MARPKKIGLEYFPVDVQFDEKVDAIEMLHGNNGLAWVIKFWQSAYKTDVGEINLTGLFAELFANKCRITIDEHTKILKTAIDIQFCYKTEDGLYTSNGIKKRISAVSKERLNAIERQEERKDKDKDKVKETPHYSANNLKSLNKKEKNDGQKQNKTPYKDPDWRDNTDEGFSEYLKLSEPHFDALLSDWSWVAIQKEYYPGCCVKRTMFRMWEQFWGTKAGWKNKRDAARGKPDYEMNWKQTIERNFKKSICYYGKNEADDEKVSIETKRKFGEL